jgi:hypothetical protein
MAYEGDICNIISLIALIMLCTGTPENGRFSPTLAYSFVLLLQKPDHARERNLIHNLFQPLLERV